MRTILVGVEAAGAVSTATSLTTASSSYIVRRSRRRLLGSIALAGAGASLVDGFCGWFGLTIRILIGGVAFLSNTVRNWGTRIAGARRKGYLPSSS